MTISLEGCRLTPLSGYLKALGILRLVHLQREPEIRGRWKGNFFVLQGQLNKEQLVEFFLEKYSPTPLVAPWNGGSGFFPGDNKTALQAILDSEEERFAPYAAVINEIFSWTELPSSPDSIGSLLAFLENEAQKKGETKEGEKFRNMANEIGKPPVINGLNPLELPVEKEELEKDIKKKKPEFLQKSRAWRKAVGKGLTACIQIKRAFFKDIVMNSCRCRLPDEVLDWLDAVYALTGSGGISFAPVLGSGANDGRLDLTSNFMRRITEVLIAMPRDTSRELLKASLFDLPAKSLVKAKIGFYDPGRAGGYNQGTGIEQKDFSINPWDYVLMLEGLPMLAASVSRRFGRAGAVMCSPFTAKHTRTGYESAGGDKDRNETWLPVWENPASFHEVRFLFQEGRSTVKRRAAKSGLDFVRAAATLGVDRGIQCFQRYIYLERRGNNYVALPAGVISVKERREVNILNEVDPLLMSVDQFLRSFGKSVPAAFENARKRIEACLFSCAQESSPLNFRNLVRSFGAMEKLVAQRDRRLKANPERPFTGLSPRWISLCDGGSGSTPEVMLSGALSSIGCSGKVGPLRTYLSGVDPRNPYAWSSESHRCWYGISLEERLCRLLMRRQLDAGRLSVKQFPGEGVCSLTPKDIVPFLEKQTNDALIEELLWGFLWIDWRRKVRPAFHGFPSQDTNPGVLSRFWVLMKLCHLTQPLGGEEIPREPRIAQLLFAGRAEKAEWKAKLRLTGSGYKPYSVQFSTSLSPRRILSSLLFPVKITDSITSLVIEKRTEQ